MGVPGRTLAELLGAALAGFTVMLGVWAAAAITVTAAGGGLRALLPLLVLALGAGIAAFWFDCRRIVPVPMPMPMPMPVDVPDVPAPPAIAWGVALLGVALLSAMLVAGSLHWLAWIGAFAVLTGMMLTDQPDRRLAARHGFYQFLMVALALSAVLAARQRMIHYPEQLTPIGFAGGWNWALVPVAALVVLVWPQAQRHAAGPGRAHPCRDGALLAAALLAAVAGTLLSHRPDADDYHYLDMCFRLREGIDHSILANWRAADDSNPAMAIYIWHPYEMLVAALSQAFHLPVLTVYYLIMPPAGAVLIVAVWYVCAHEFTPKDAVWVVAMALVVAFCWGEIHRAPGNFAFVRLFQGKSWLANVGGPLFFWLGLRWARRRGGWDAVLLGFALCAAVGMTHTGAVTAPLAMGLGAWTGGRSESRHRDLLALTFAGSLFPWVVMGVADMMIFGVWMKRGYFRTEETLAYALPPDFRSILGLAAIVLLPYLMPQDQRRRLLRLAFFVVVAVLNPLGIEVLSHLVWSVQWRVLWAVPSIFLTALFLVALARAEAASWRWPLGTAAVVVVYGLAGHTTLSPDNYNQFGQMGYVLPADHLEEYLRRDAALP